jgi:hypothetical protein
MGFDKNKTYPIVEYIKRRSCPVGKAGDKNMFDLGYRLSVENKQQAGDKPVDLTKVK